MALSLLMDCTSAASKMKIRIKLQNGKIYEASAMGGERAKSTMIRYGNPVVNVAFVYNSTNNHAKNSTVAMSWDG